MKNYSLIKSIVKLFMKTCEKDRFKCIDSAQKQRNEMF